jgi:hypothetical protein
VAINAIHVNPMCPFHFALGAADPWARVFDVRCGAASEFLRTLLQASAQPYVTKQPCGPGPYASSRARLFDARCVAAS